MDNIVYAYYHSIYNHGKYSAKSICKVNLDRQEVFDIEISMIPDGADSLDEEYVQLLDGSRKEVVIHEEDKNMDRLLLVFWWNITNKWKTKKAFKQYH